MASTEQEEDVGLFDQQIPVRLELAENENLSPDPVNPVYLMAPRQSYLPALALQVLPSFAHVLPPVLPAAAEAAPAPPAAPPPAPPLTGGEEAAAAADAPPAAPSAPPKPPSAAATTSTGPASPWLDYEGLPLKGNLPVGVLFDLIAAPLPSKEEQEAEQNQGGGGASGAAALERRAAALASAAAASGRLPWRLTLHYRLAPPGGRAAWAGGWENDVPPREHWLGALKEAAFCLAGGAEGAKSVMRLRGEQQDALWAAAARGDALGYARAAEPLGLAPKARHGALPCVPVRVLIRPAPEPGETDDARPTVWERTFATSRPVPVLVPLPEKKKGAAEEAPPPPPLFGVDEDAPAAPRPVVPTRAALLADALHGVAPALFPAEVVERAVAAAAGGGGAEGGARAEEAGSGGGGGQAPALPAVLVGGVCPPLSCPLAWLHARMCGPDAFLYVVVRCR